MIGSATDLCEGFRHAGGMHVPTLLPAQVVVDTFAEFRARDVMKLAEEMDENFETDRKFLQKVFNRVLALLFFQSWVCHRRRLTL